MDPVQPLSEWDAEVRRVNERRGTQPPLLTQEELSRREYVSAPDEIGWQSDSAHTRQWECERWWWLAFNVLSPSPTIEDHRRWAGTLVELTERIAFYASADKLDARDLRRFGLSIGSLGWNNRDDLSTARRLLKDADLTVEEVRARAWSEIAKRSQVREAPGRDEHAPAVLTAQSDDVAKSPWSRDREGGALLRGWADIVEVVGIGGARKARESLKRWNQRFGGPISYDGRVPQVRRSALIAFWADLQLRFDAVDDRGEDDAVFAKYIQERGDAPMRDIGLSRRKTKTRIKRGNAEQPSDDVTMK